MIRHRLTDKQVRMLIDGEALYFMYDRIVASESMKRQLRTMNRNAAAYIVENRRGIEIDFKIEIGLK